MELGFDQVDDLGLASESNPIAIDSLVQLTPKNIGPLVEYEWLRRSGRTSLLGLDTLTRTRRLQLFRAVISGERHVQFNTETARCQFITFYWQRDDEEPESWFFFCHSMQKAAEAIGIPFKNAQELVATARELMSNVFDHSGSSNTGIAGFAASHNEFELVIADAGIGVLQSLRTSEEFKDLNDAGKAIHTALTEGASRFDHKSGHGGGFNPLFQSFLNLSGALRFRSGDHALTIDGVSPSLSTARLRQKLELPGFIVSALCRT